VGGRQAAREFGFVNDLNAGTPREIQKRLIQHGGLRFAVFGTFSGCGD
jgi:hypothetical protein